MPRVISQIATQLPAISISRWEGAVFLGHYVAYTGCLALAAQPHDALPVFGAVLSWFVMPLTIITLVVVTWRALARRSPRAARPA